MRPRLIGALLTLLIAASPVGGQRHSLRVQGHGGFGFSLTGTGTSENISTGFRNLGGDVGLEASGYLYDPRLVNYSTHLFWTGQNFSLDQGSSRSSGLNLGVGFSFLSLRAFPFSIYYARGTTDAGGGLASPFTTTTTRYGLRGELRAPRFAYIHYNFGLSRNDNDLADGGRLRFASRFANVTASRRLRGWELRAVNDYQRASSSFANTRDWINTSSLDVTRLFDTRVSASFGVSHSLFDLRDLGSGVGSRSGVTSAAANLSWNHSAKLNSSYQFNLTRNAVNTLRLLGNSSGLPGGALAFDDSRINSTTESFGATLSYRPASNWSFSAGTNYMHSGFPPERAAELPAETRSLLATGVFGANGGGRYQRKLGRLNFHTSANLHWQRLNLIERAGDSSLGYGAEAGVSGGDVRRLLYTAAYRYNRRTNPVFFNVLTSNDHRITLRLETRYFRFVHLQGTADIGRSQLDLLRSALNLDRSSYSLSATFPAQRLSMFASHGNSNSAERLFGADSVIFEPGGSTGGVPLPSDLFIPLVYSDVSTDRVGALWRPRRNLQMQGRYSRSRYEFLSSLGSLNHYGQFDVLAEYKFGRFTLYGGYGRATSDSRTRDQHTNRLLFRVRFPFRLL